MFSWSKSLEPECVLYFYDFFRFDKGYNQNSMAKQPQRVLINNMTKYLSLTLIF